MHVPAPKKLVNEAPPAYPLFVNESRMLKKYMYFLEQRDKPVILDIGPVSGSNISFFLNCASKLHVFDMLAETHQAEDAEHFLSLFDYQEYSLDGIHLWDVPDHLNNRLLSLLVRKLHSLLKPDGLMTLIASTTSGVQPYPLFFAIRDDCTAFLQKTTTRRLSYFYRTNRDIERSMRPFKQFNSFICTNGIREFLFKSSA
jgi:hypothetical protein